MPTRQQVENALIERYTKDYKTNPQFDRKRAKANGWEEDPGNPEFVSSAREERLRQGPWVIFTASDGYPAMASATLEDIVDVLEDAGLVEP